MTTWIRSAITGMVLERPAKKLTLAQHAARLEANGETLRKRFAEVSGTEENAERLRHIIGIERWGQSRVVAALGDDVDESDDYEAYRPGDDAGWDALRMEFDETRQGTVALALDLDAAAVDIEQVIRHNQHGNISVRAWLWYLDMHANMEGQRIK